MLKVVDATDIRATAARPVFTVGHGARSADAFLSVLQDADIQTLLDVRRFPGSRRHPHFGRDALAASLQDHGIRYQWHGEDLGGRRRQQPESRHTALLNAGFAGYADHMDSPDFREAVDMIVARTNNGERLALMCAETLWWRCHRSLVADALACRATEVVHLLDVGRRDSHRLRSTARCADDGWPAYDIPDTPPLDG